jgi:antitoxin HicB
MKNFDYPVSIRPLSQREGGGYIAKVLDLPGCIADGETPEKASQEVLSAIDSWIKTAKEFGDLIPTSKVNR